MTLMKMRWRILMILMMVVMVMMGGTMNTGFTMRKQLSQASDVTGLLKKCGMTIKDYWRQDRRERNRMMMNLITTCILNPSDHRRQDRRKDRRERNRMMMNLITTCILNPSDHKWKKFIGKTKKTEDRVQNKIQNGSTYNDQHILQQSPSQY